MGGERLGPKYPRRALGPQELWSFSWERPEKFNLKSASRWLCPQKWSLTFLVAEGHKKIWDLDTLECL